METEISVVVPTFNSEKEITRLLNSLFPLRDNLEVIVVDAGSGDTTTEQVENFSFPLLVSLPGVSKGKARDRGRREAEGDVIVNLDSDVEIQPGWYEALKKSMDFFDIVAGYSPHPKKGHIPRASIWVDGQDITWPFCNIAHKKEVFDKVGNILDTEFSEDIDYNYRCVKKGYTIGYNPNMKVIHHHTPGKRDFMRQSFLYGRCRALVDERYPELRRKHQHGFTLRDLSRLTIGGLGFIYQKLNIRRG